MFWIFIALAYVTIVIAWVLGKALSAQARWSDEHPHSVAPAKYRDVEFDFGTLGLVFAMVLLFLLVPSVVTAQGQTVYLHEITDSMQTSMDVDTLNFFASAWRAEYPLKFWAFFAGLPVTVIWLFRRSPGLFGVAVVATLFVFWLRQ